MSVMGGDNQHSSNQQDPADDVAELFEDENEQFIRSLERKAPSSAANAPQAAKELDHILPDVEPEPEAEEQLAPTPSTPTPSQSEAPSETLTALSHLPVNISLELGKVSCSLQKLIDLRENDVIELDQPVGQIINLRVDGQLIGKGQIVRLGDQLGLRIQELADR